MASSSTPASASASTADGNNCYQFDVFLNHRGPDVKKTFVSHLYKMLTANGLKVCMDAVELQRGENISAVIDGAIRAASVHLPIFSPNYCQSPWCLNDLLLILEMRQKKGSTILPIFFHVKRSELKWTEGGNGVYAQSLSSLSKKRTSDSQSRHDSDIIGKWRRALSDVADISGFALDEAPYNGDEGKLLVDVIEEVMKVVSKIPPHDARYPTGLVENVPDFEKKVLLQKHESAEARVVETVGLGGVGKTTLAKEFFMASSASAASTSISNYVYDVFINCHGPEVKRTFANHLYHRLASYGLRPFVDEERHKEDNIGTQIKEAIATASVHVAIFSLRYAESRRCLDELLLMLASGAPVIPVFYTVKRFDLQCTKDKDGVYAGVFGRALQNHEKGTTYESQASGEKPRDMSNTIEEWRKALHRISEISGFELEAFKDDEAELLDAVVKSVFKSVRKAPFYEFKYLKGLDQKVEDFENTVLLHRQSGKPQVVGIVGVAGVGKTTLAKELINRKSSSFNRICFLFDVSGTVALSSLHFLQSKLFKDLTNMNIQIESVTQGIELFTKHFSPIHGATAFVILDNVDNVDQLKALLPVQKLLPSKSLILITSRFKDVLIDSGVEQSLIYSLTDLPLDKHPSGLDGKVKDLTNIILLQQQSEEPQVLGIVGISGIGKTRLAMEFFNRKSSDYTRSYFLYDVNETARTSFTLHNLQSKLLQGLTQLDLQVQGVDEGIELFKEHVSYFRSLVILDNVDHWDQLHELLSVLTVLPSGSLILVTCREKDVLKRSGVQESSIYELDPLNDEDSLELFCTRAFHQPSPRHEFEDLAGKFVRACNGLPLTLNVFGALLWEKNNSYWQTLFDKFDRIHHDQIQKRLQLCYDELNQEEQKIFLHIACSCIGAKRDFAIRLWDASGFTGWSVFESLQNRCLVDVDREDCIIMHELLIELGRTNADEKGLRRPPRPRRENDSDLFRP